MQSFLHTFVIIVSVSVALAGGTPPPFEPDPLIIPTPRIGGHLASVLTLPQSFDVGALGSISYLTEYGSDRAGVGNAYRQANGFWRLRDEFGPFTGYMYENGSDLDADGNNEMILYQAGNGVRVFEFDEIGQVSEVGGAAVPFDAGTVFTLDGDGDGDEDVLVRDAFVTSGGFVAVFEHTDQHVHTLVSLLQIGDGVAPSYSGEMNGSAPVELLGFRTEFGIGFVIETYLSEGPLQWGDRVRSVFPGIAEFDVRRGRVVPDFTGDGIADIIIGAWNDIEGDPWMTDHTCLLLEGSADGTFVISATLVREATIGRNESQIVLLGDVTGDGLADAALTTRVRGGGGVPTPKDRYGPSQTWILTSGNTPSSIRLPSEFGLCKGSIVIEPNGPQVPVGFRADVPYALVGEYTLIPDVAHPEVVDLARGSFLERIAFENPIGTYDFDDDGDVDLLIQDRDRIRVALNESVGGQICFESDPFEFGFSQIDRVETISIAESGCEMLGVVGESSAGGHAAIFSVDPDGTIQEVWSDDQPNVIRSLTASDLDGDGFTDIAVLVQTPEEDGAVHVHRGSAAGDFAFDVSIFVDIDDSGVPETILIDDFDADGLFDLVVLTQSTTPGSPVAEVLWNLGGMSFSEQTTVPGNGLRLAFWMRAADLDGDGRPELAIGSDRGTNAGVFSLDPVTGANLRSMVDVVDLQLTGFELGDVDGDARLDLVQARREELFIAFGVGDATFTPPIVVELPKPSISMVLVPIDGKDAILVADRSLSSEVYRWDAGALQLSNEISVPTRPNFLTTVRAPAGEILISASLDGRIGRLLPTQKTCLADLAEPFGELNFFDVAAYIGLYNNQDPAADLAAPFGALNFFDVAAFIGAYNAGCP